MVTGYEGKLYDFASSTGKPSEQSNYGQGTSNYREPSLVVGGATYRAKVSILAGALYDAKSKYHEKILGYSSAKAFGNALQSEFNEMINSVNKYKGFYVGRYETSLDGNKNAQSKPQKDSATALESSANMWYGLYQIQKQYSNNNNLNNVVVSRMMTGTQYDQMMIWMYSNGINVASSTPINIEGKSGRNRTKKTGSTETDKLCNIYDLIGGTYEWTQEAWSMSWRISRGGGYDNSNPPCNSKNEQPVYPNDTDKDYGSRITLYIK